MIATSRSGKSQPAMRPDNAAFVPVTHSVQSPLLSSIHRPALFLRTMWLTRGGGGFVFEVAMAGKKLVPELGGGSWPRYGPFVASTGPGEGGVFNSVSFRPRTVVPLPDS